MYYLIIAMLQITIHLMHMCALCVYAWIYCIHVYIIRVCINLMYMCACELMHREMHFCFLSRIKNDIKFTIFCLFWTLSHLLRCKCIPRPCWANITYNLSSPREKKNPLISHSPTQRNISREKTKHMSVLFQINRKMVNTIWFRFD